MNKRIMQVLDDLVEQIEAGTMDWKKCWRSGMPFNPFRQDEYHGINVLTLWAASVQKQYNSQYWATYKQWKELGMQVKEGEKGSPVIYHGTANADDDERKYKFTTLSWSFNADQLTEKYEVSMNEYIKAIPPIDEWLASFGIPLVTAPGPVYFPDRDCIGMPPMQMFEHIDGYYVSYFHELAHSTGHHRRLKREVENTKQSYAAEELVAEMTSAFLGAHFNLEPDQHASYLQSWLRAFDKDKRSTALFFAARHAKDAYNWCLEHGAQVQLQHAAE